METITIKSIKYKPEGKKPGVAILENGTEVKWWPKTVKGIAVGATGLAEIEEVENEYGLQLIINEFTPQGSGRTSNAPRNDAQPHSPGNTGGEDRNRSIESQAAFKAGAELFSHRTDLTPQEQASWALKAAKAFFEWTQLVRSEKPDPFAGE